MRRPVPIQQLRAVSSTSSLRWTMGRDLSLRAYNQHATRRDQFCVSTRSSELTFILEGEMWLEMGPARQQLRLGPEQACLVTRGTPHRLTTAAGTRFLILDVNLPDSQLSAAPIEAAGLSPVLVRWLPHLWESTPPQVGESVEREIASLLDRCARSAMPFEPTHNTARMAQVKRYLEEHFAEPVDLGALAAQLGLDRFYLLRAFKQNFGVPPLAYINDLRLEHFIWTMLLEGRTRDLTDLSSEAGFSDYSTFCRRIRKLLGRPPSQLLAPP